MLKPYGFLSRSDFLYARLIYNLYLRHRGKPKSDLRVSKAAMLLAIVMQLGGY